VAAPHPVIPSRAEAKAELLKLIEGRRRPPRADAQTILGRVLYGTDAGPKDQDGNRIEASINGESTHFPTARRTEAAPVRLGLG
jgi:hypothetical protein